MRGLRNTLVLILVVTLMSCNTEGTESIDKTALTEEIKNRLDAFVGHNNNLEVESLKDFYSNDERFYWVEDGQVQYPNKKVLLASLEGLVGMISDSDMRILNTKIQVMNATSAMIFLEYEQAMTMSSGGGFDINGAMTVLMQKEAGIWRFLIGHSSTKKQRGE